MKTKRQKESYDVTCYEINFYKRLHKQYSNY